MMERRETNNGSGRFSGLVVGVGASAGGLEALEQFFRPMPVDSGMAFVVVQHLAPDFKSVMDDLLGRITQIPIRVIENGMSVESNCIHLMPSNHELICAGGKLLLTERSPGHELSFPIDQFFRSLADDATRRAVAVVLSGTGTDGSRGICSVHEAGGLVLAQDEGSAKFNGMPRAAFDTGLVDMVMPADEMSQALVTYSKTPDQPPEHNPEAETMQGPMYTVFHLLKKESGVDFGDYKTTTISRRIQRRVALAGLPDLETYVRVLRNDASEVVRLYKDLLIGVTTFFRDQEVFDRLEIDVIPNLLREMDPDREFRAWVVGTATGEEAYSLAILLREYLDANDPHRRVKIFATDVHRDSLEFASRGVYAEECLAGVSKRRLDRFFLQRSDGYHVSPELRKMVVCVAHNMVRDAPFTKIDLVTCRNVLIYLTPQAQNKAISLFHFALNRHGALCLGPSETLGDVASEFSPIDDKAKIFRKHRDSLLPSSQRLPISIPAMEVSRPPRVSRTGQIVGGLSIQELFSAYDALLTEYSPPGLLVNAEGTLLHVFGGPNPFVPPAQGRISNNVLDRVHPRIRSTLSTALRRAKDSREVVIFQGVQCDLEDKPVELCIHVQPLFNSAEEEAFLLVRFEVSEGVKEPEPVVPINVRNVSGDEFLALERELQESRDNLQATIEQSQTTNEELQSANEQLIASNEELQSTNEELHSVNEELYTVNAEHQRKIEELTELTNDMDNLLTSTHVHTIFLDRDLCIRRFTPGIADTFNLISQDVGRRIDTFTYTILDSDLVSEIQHVLEVERPFEREVWDRKDNCFLMRILPYLSSGRVDGVVLTLIEITTLKTAERRLAELSEIVEHSDDAILRVSTEGVVTTWNAGAQKLFGFKREEAIGQHVAFFAPPELQDESRSVLAHAIEGALVDRFETQRLCKNGDVIDVALTLSPIRNENGEVVGASEIIRDVTLQKQAEKEVREAVKNRDQFLAMLSHELRNPMAAVLNAATVLREDGIDNETETEARSIIERNVRHVARLLDDLLDLSRFTHDKIALHRQVIDLAAMAVDVVDCVQPLIDEKDHQLHLQVQSEPVYLDGDAGRLQQAQVNLLVNAAKYTRSGGRIDYSVRSEGNEAVITVRDNGIGIGEKLLSDIFQPFVQTEQALDRSQGGMGLGLPLVRMIVEAHGGNIVAQSGGISQGSEFTIRLPLTTLRPQKPKRRKSALGSGKTMVIVEDNVSIRRMLAASMRMKEFEVSTAADGGMGLEVIIDKNPDIALIDIGLPDVNGYELARRIREKSGYENLLLVAVTGYGRESDQDEAIDAGFDLHLVKPLDPNEVLTAISEYLAKQDGETSDEDVVPA